LEKRPAIDSHTSSLGIGVKAFSLVSAIRALGTHQTASGMKNPANAAVFEMRLDIIESRLRCNSHDCDRD